jgi:cytochrome c
MAMRDIAAVVSAILFCTTMLSASEKPGTTAEAEAMVKKAVAFIKANGTERGLAEVSKKQGKFVDRDLYVFVYDMNGKCVAHGGNPKMIGKGLIDLKDPSGKEFVKERIGIAKSKGKGWQNYQWNNPAKHRIENKTAYVEKCGDLIVGCGAYE